MDVGNSTSPAGTSSACVTDAMDWSWPPYAPIELAAEPFDTPDWAPASVVRYPAIRVGRWTVLYRRAA
ncbi:hypothetical protein GCM10027300_35820 [Modestobacter lapidis]